MNESTVIKISWNQGLATGIESIDRQHMELIALINGLMTAVAEEHEQTQVDRVVNFLERYVVEHFSLEEAYMVESEYPGLIKHRALHLDFIKNLEGIKARVAQPNQETGPLLKEIFDLGCRWFLEHITTADQQLARWLAPHLPDLVKHRSPD